MQELSDNAISVIMAAAKQNNDAYKIAQERYMLPLGFAGWLDRLGKTKLPKLKFQSAKEAKKRK